MTRRLALHVVNESGEALERIQHKLLSGALSGAPPAEALAPGERTTWFVEGDGVLGGDVSYNLAKSGALFEAAYRDDPEGMSGFSHRTWPKASRNKVGGRSEAARTSGKASAQVDVTYTVKPVGEALPKPSADGLEAVATPGQTSHFSLPVGNKVAMIVPAGDSKALRAKALKWALDDKGVAKQPDIAEQNLLWGEQWAGLKPNPQRKLFFVKASDTYDAFIDKAIEAAKWAAGGEVAVLIGHGRGTRVNSTTSDVYTEIDLIPESGGLSTHKHRLTSDVFHVADHTYDAASGTMTLNKGAQAWAFKESPKVVRQKWARLLDLAAAFEEHKVLLFTVLACRAGASSDDGESVGSRASGGMFPEFGSSLARSLGVTVRLYAGWVAIAEQSNTAWVPKAVEAKWQSVLEQIWVSPSHDDPTRGSPGEKSDPMDPGYSEVPTAMQMIWNKAGARL